MTGIPNPLDPLDRPPAESPTQVKEVAAETVARLDREFLAAGIEADVRAQVLRIAGPILTAALMRVTG